MAVVFSTISTFNTLKNEGETVISKALVFLPTKNNQEHSSLNLRLIPTFTLEFPSYNYAPNPAETCMRMEGDLTYATPEKHVWTQKGPPLTRNTKHTVLKLRAGGTVTHGTDLLRRALRFQLQLRLFHWILFNIRGHYRVNNTLCRNTTPSNNTYVKGERFVSKPELCFAKWIT